MAGQDMLHGLSQPTESPPLHILIVGAGIGGLTAAIALRRQGHNVDIFEQSKLAEETGAAIHLASNANGLLRRLGLYAEEIGAVECEGVVEYLPHSGVMKYSVNTKAIGDTLWTHPWHLVHRAHLHSALRQLATSENGEGPPANLHVSSKVLSVDAKTATITFNDGTQIQGDLVVGADGVHSMARSAINGGDLQPFDSGKSAFRFLVPTEILTSDPDVAELIQPSRLVMWIAEDRRLIMYPCVNNSVMNFVAIHPSELSRADISTGAGWQETGSKDRMVEIYKAFHAGARAILQKAAQPKVWNLLDMKQLPTFISHNLVLLGDAAHPFLPHQGQGGGMAIEDAIALATLLPFGTMPQDITERLQLYEHCRYERAHRIQDFTRTAGKDAAELAKEGKVLNMHEYQNYNFGHDAFDHATSVLRRHLEGKDPTLRWRSPLGFGPSPSPRRPLGLPSSHARLKSLRQSTQESFRTYAVKFVTSRTYLQNILPPGFNFSSPGTKAYASLICTTLDGMTWLAGKGYSHCGLYLHGVEYAKRDASNLYGTFVSILFENICDPIITGRDEIGLPKLFADIDIQPEASSCRISLSWRGAVFASVTISDLIQEVPQVNETAEIGRPQSVSTPPPSPPDQGQFAYRYVPAVGLPGKVDAEYPVFIPQAVQSQPAEVFVTKTAELTFHALDWNSLPTLHHVAKGLSEMPIYGIEEARLTSGIGIGDLGNAVRIE